MTERQYNTPNGTIHYWVNKHIEGRETLVLLPGLSADHTLFDKQIEAFEDKYNILVWDAPGHALSRPFRLDFTLRDKAHWLHEILEAEGISQPVLVGQSMGGYVSQVYMQEFPGQTRAFVSIDSSTLKLKYYPKWELNLLDHIEPLYRMFPWKALVREGAKGTAETPYGQALMTRIMESYSDDTRYYAKLVGHGYSMLADAIRADLPYEIDCPCILICGEKDKAGDTKKFNKQWAKGENLPIRWIAGAGHNSNTDRPDDINDIIVALLARI